MSTSSIPVSVVAPRQLIEYIESLPYLGKLTSSHDKLVAGSTGELVLIYEVGASGVADTGRIKITFKFYSDWALFQTDTPTEANYLTATLISRPFFAGETSVRSPRIVTSFDPKGHGRPYQKSVIVDLVDGYLKPGDKIEIRLGDRRKGGTGTRVQTFVEDQFTLRGYVDTAGTSRFSTIPNDLIIQIIPGDAAELQIATPRLVRRGEDFLARLIVLDVWGNAVHPPQGEVKLSIRQGDEKVLSEDLKWSPGRWAVATWKLRLLKPGDYTITAEWKNLSARAELTVKDGLPIPRAYFADLHIHSHNTVGTNTTQYNIEYARDVAGLDIFGYTVNDFQVTEGQWNEDLALCRQYHQENGFIIFPGTEWCGNSALGGDHNIVFLGDEVIYPHEKDSHSVRSFIWNATPKGDQQAPGRWPLTDLYSVYAHKPEKFLLIPHIGGRRANLDWHHPELERLIEITSSWGHFEWFYQDAIVRGYKLGASAAGDEHRGRPGGGNPGAGIFGAKGGLTGVLSPNLTRESVARALRSRHTWATTSERNVALLSSGHYLQGDELPWKEQSRLKYSLFGSDGWEYVAARDDKGIVWERNLHRELGFSPDRFRLRWGGARIPDRYRWAEWFGTLEINGAETLEVTPIGLEHPEENIYGKDSRLILFHTETYGDSDAVEFSLSETREVKLILKGEIFGFRKTGNQKDAHPFVDQPSFQFEIGLSELLESENGIWSRHLGGQELYVSLERVTEKNLPARIEGEFDLLLPYLEKDYPIYVTARERTLSKVWTSPLFFIKNDK